MAVFENRNHCFETRYSVLKWLGSFAHMSQNRPRKKSLSLWKMGNVETIEEFYKKKFDWIPDNLRNEIGHFNIFKLPPYVEGQPPSIPYKRRDFYKVMLVMGNSQVHYADKAK